jgi:hypothetical protein
MITSVLKTAFLYSQIYASSGLLLRPMMTKQQAISPMSSGKSCAMAMEAVADRKLVPVTILTVMRVSVWIYMSWA